MDGLRDTETPEILLGSKQLDRMGPLNRNWDILNVDSLQHRSISFLSVRSFAADISAFWRFASRF